MMGSVMRAVQGPVRVASPGRCAWQPASGALGSLYFATGSGPLSMVAGWSSCSMWRLQAGIF